MTQLLDTRKKLPDAWVLLIRTYYLIPKFSYFICLYLFFISSFLLSCYCHFLPPHLIKRVSIPLPEIVILLPLLLLKPPSRAA